ncbi:redoxin domain-containing protein [Jannaschia sp. Os4]|uniref:redoxin domain-containing protein n=1 Tax=Jannaschia sp. Os4 TaxID=2807617 RepID=UPI00193A62CD|nr:redoxin domain-containing protein [Jannaschia sp. Os4]MBM2575943.1 redoxin domain-containing protein [Jannaschia sp. Os4]
MPTTPTPGQPAPALSVPLIDGHHWTLSERSPEAFTMIVFYRGRHCPICLNHLDKLKADLPEWLEAGIDVLAVSMDDEDRARDVYEGWDDHDGLAPLALGHSMDRATAEAWGLYLSSSRAEKEPDLFSEPGLAWVKPDGTLWFMEVASTPFVRPDMDMLRSKVGFIRENAYPPRGMAS